jgi:hypothetical protein
LSFELDHEAKFKVGDWCTVFGERYILAENPPPVTKETKFNYKYTLTLKSFASELEKIQYFFLGEDNLLREPEFSVTGTAQTFIDLLLLNTERWITDNTNFGPPGLTYDHWSAPDVLTTDYKTITFANDNCLSALSKIAEAFGTEWWVTGKKIYVAKVINDTSITLKHGRRRGLYDITRQAADNSRLITVVFPYGGDKNIPSDYGSLRLKSNYPFNRISNNETTYGVIEQVVIFEDIYPKRTGKVTGVDATNFFKFTDTTINFDLFANLLPGLSPKVVFNTGQLAGYTFEIGAWDNGTKTITLLKNKDETSIDVPSNLLRPEIGDQYVFVDIKLPATYITEAEQKLFAAAADYLLQYSVPRFSFSINLDPIYVRNNNLEFSIGDMIWVKDDDLEIDRKIRIVSTSRNIVEENKYALTLSDGVPQGTVQAIQSNVASTQANVSQITTTLKSGLLFNGRMSLPETTDVTGMSQLYIDNNTDKIYKKV